MSLTKASYAMVTGAPINVLDYGADPTGSADSAAAFTTAITAAPSSGCRIYVPAGTYLVNSKITINKEILLFGDGCLSTTGGDAATKILKGAAMTTALIDITEGSVSIEHIGFEGVTGNTGDGIHVLAGRTALRNVSCHKMGNDGIRIGGDNNENCNLFILDRVFTRNNGRHGVYIHDTLSTGGPDTNGGLINLLESALNGGDGLKMENCWYNTVVSLVTQVNTGYGLNIVCGAGPSYVGSRYHTIIGGDQNEGNTAGEVYNSGYCCVFTGTDYSDFTDVGTFTTAVLSTGTKIYSATFNSTQSGVDDGAVLATGALGSTIYPVRVRNLSNESNGRGVGIEFQPPNATAGYRVGGHIISSQVTTNKDQMSFVVNNSGSMVPMLNIDPNSGSVNPVADNTFTCGSASSRWSVIYAGTGTINTSDERDKQDFKDLSEAEREAAIGVKALLKSFKFKDAVAKKGDKARIHFGVAAQQVAEVFKSVNLNPDDYAMFCYDEWEEICDEDGNVLQKAGNRYGIRYDELLAFIIGAL